MVSLEMMVNIKFCCSVHEFLFNLLFVFFFSQIQVTSDNLSKLALQMPFISILGAMASFAAFYLAGLYPLPATTQYLLSSPFFPQISFFNPLFNTTTTIISKGFTGNPPDGTGGNVFVQVRLSNLVAVTMGLNFFLERCCEWKALQVKLLP